MRMMPFDVQTCTVDIMAYTINFPINLRITNEFQQFFGAAKNGNSEWKLTNITLENPGIDSLLQMVIFGRKNNSEI